MEKQNRKEKYFLYVFFCLCLIAYSALMYRLFYRQTSAAGLESYRSDMKAYLQTMLGQESGYDFPYPLYFLLGEFFLLFTDVETAGALAATVLNTLSVIVLAYYMRQSLQKNFALYVDASPDTNHAALKNSAKKQVFMGILTILLTFSIFFVSMLYAPKGVYLPGMTHKYLGVFTPNPYHNATYLAARPFAIVTFFLYVRILDYYEERSDRKEFFWFGFFLFLTTMTKPSYTLVLVSAAGLLMLWRLFRKKWRNFRRSLYLGISFLPTFIVLLYQFGGVFGRSSHAGESGGVGFGVLSAWKVYMENIPLAIILALAFPGFFLLFHFKDLKENTMYRFAWFQLLVSLFELMFLYEKGDRFIHLNFSWGYMYGLLFVFIASLILLTRDTLQKKRKSYMIVAEWLAYGWHLFCGITYFLYIWSGQSFDSF